jgi:hypothetical protein
LCALRGDLAVAALARRIGDWLARDAVPPLRSMEAMRCQLEMRERLGDRVAHLFRLAVTPTFEDWAWLRLPGGLLGLHYLLRPIRLAAKHGARLGGRAP